jgi:hypothetical protein
MQIGGENIEFFLVNMVLEKNLLWRHRSGKVFFHFSLLKNELNEFQFGIVQMMIYDLWNLELSPLNQLRGIIITRITV